MQEIDYLVQNKRRKMLSIKDLKEKKWIFGMVHLGPLPGSPNYKFNNEEIISNALKDAENLISSGVDGIIVENYGDWPFTNKTNLSQIMLQSIASYEVRKKYPDIPLGVNVHYNAFQEEAHLASVIDADFIRVEVFVDTVVYDGGILYPVSGDILRLRSAFRGKFLIFADIHPKHTQLILPKTIADSAHGAEKAMADAIIVTGKETGSQTPISAIKEAREVVSLPIFAGSGVTLENVLDTLEVADGIIIGSYFKYDNNVFNPVEKNRVVEFMKEVRKHYK